MTGHEPTAGNILLVDDETNIREGLKATLRKDGHDVRDAATATAALSLLATFPAEVAVLDIRMPGMSGTELLAEIKAGWPHIAVIMLTGHGTLQTAITAVKEGAFDYLLKPAKPEAIRVVVARALAESRRQREQAALLQALQAGLERLHRLPATPPFSQPNLAASTAILRVGDLIIDRAAYEVRFRGQAVALTPAEYKVLVVLAERAGSAVDYISLVRAGLEYDAEAWEAKELIKRHIYTLRQKLEPQPDQPAFILNVRGVGYRLVR
ncbi:MAG: response regulator transcription factor [Anaerolineae bacterium]|nr:response regulator transcription factor [Anaerolineae bacterium]